MGYGDLLSVEKEKKKEGRKGQFQGIDVGNWLYDDYVFQVRDNRMRSGFGVR